MGNADCISFVLSEVRPEHAAGRTVLDVGALDVNGSVRPWIEKLGPASYTGVDIAEGPGVDVICDAEKLLDRFEAGSVDLLVSTELIEHVRDWRAVLSNFKRLVKPGGYLLVTTRSIGFHYHGYPYDFWRYEIADMQRLFADCEIVTLRKDRQHKGVFIYARKPADFREADLSDHALHSIVSRRRMLEVSERDERVFRFFYSFERFRQRYLSTRRWKKKKRWDVPFEQLDSSSR